MTLLLARETHNLSLAENLRSPFLSDVLEYLPQTVFVKNANPAFIDNDDKALKYVYFNEWFEIVSGFDRHALIGENAKDHFSTDYPLR